MEPCAREPFRVLTAKRRLTYGNCPAKFVGFSADLEIFSEQAAVTNVVAR